MLLPLSESLKTGKDVGGNRKNISLGELPGDPVVRAPRSHCRGRVQSLVRELRSHKLHGVAKKQKIKQNKKQKRE